MPSEFRGTEVFGRQPSAPRPSSQKPRSVVKDFRPRNLLGVLATCAALFTAVVTAAGIGSAMSGRFEVATWLAYLADGTSVVALICGAAAVVTRRGRGWGLAAIILGALASPPLLTNLLGWASGLG